METTRKLTRVQEAYVRCKPASDCLIELSGRCMESVTDKCGIVMERWIIGDKMKSVILFSTPHWWEVFAPVTDKKEIAATLDAIREFAK